MSGMKWDEWYLEMCRTVAKKSQCLSRQIGAVLVKDKTIISQGYNGPPRGVQPCDRRWLNDKGIRDAVKDFPQFDSLTVRSDFFRDHLQGKCPRYIPEMGFKSGQGLEWCVAGHAERNALINAARHGIATKDCKLYMDCGIPCTPCLVEIINAGIEEIIVIKMQYYDLSAEYVLKHSSLKCRVYEHLKGE